MCSGELGPPYLHSLVLWPRIYYLIWQKEIKVTNGMKVANQLTLKEGDYPGSSQWAQCNHMGPLRGRERQKHGAKRCSKRMCSTRVTPTPDLESEHGETISQGMLVSS